MSFEDDMIEAGFRNEDDYLDYICNQYDKVSGSQNSDYENEEDLEYQRELYEEKVELRRELKHVYNQFVNWRTNFPHEIDIWEGDCRNTEISNEYSPKLMVWQKWKKEREKDDKIIQEVKPQLAIIENLIYSDVILSSFNEFLHDRYNVWWICKIINEWKDTNQKSTEEFYSYNTDNWSEYDFYFGKDEEYKKKVLRSGSNPNKHEILNGERDIKDIRRLEIWVTNHILDWDDWAYKHIKSWPTLIKHGYSRLYQKVWWKKGSSENYYEWKDENIRKQISYSAEFKRRLILDKLKALHYSGGDVFNDNLSLFEEYDEYGYIDANGNIIIDVQFDDAREFYDGIAAVKVNAEEFDEYIPGLDNYLTYKCGGQWGFINQQGDFVIQPQYEILTPFKNKIAAYCKGAVLKEFYDSYIPDGGKWGIISQEGKELIPPTYDFIRLLENGVLIANMGGQRNPNNGVLSNGLWCVLSPEGNELTPFKYTWIFSYEAGRAMVNAGGICEEFEGEINCWGGEWGYIDERGNEIEPLKGYSNKYEFEEDWGSVH